MVWACAGSRNGEGEGVEAEEDDAVAGEAQAVGEDKDGSLGEDGEGDGGEDGGDGTAVAVRRAAVGVPDEGDLGLVEVAAGDEGAGGDRLRAPIVS